MARQSKSSSSRKSGVSSRSVGLRSKSRAKSPGKKRTLLSRIGRKGAMARRRKAS